ncbi:MAG: ATP-binding protein [Candidatus Zixiibacteriota bacterium]
MADPDTIRLAESIWDYSHKLFDLAHSGPSRLAFLSESAALISRALGCCSARIVIRDKDCRLCISHTPENRTEGRTAQASQTTDPAASRRWTTPGCDSLESVCNKVFNAQVDTDLPWFTPFGSLRIDDLESFPDWKRLARMPDSPDGICFTATCRSAMIIPVDGARRRLGLLQLESESTGYFNAPLIDFSEQFAHTFGIAFDIRQLQTSLRERVKELTCLYDVMRLAARDDTPLDEILQCAVETIPQGWLHADSAAARIVLRHRTYESKSAGRIGQRMSADIIIDNSKVGLIEVGYTDQMPPADNGPFLHEERDLLGAFARELALTVQQHESTEERQKLHEQLRHADRLATIGQLAAGVAHELNEPLASIMGFAQLAGKQPGLPPEITRDLNKIVAAAMHARGVIRELLVFAREAKPTKVTFSLNELIRDGLFFLESRFVTAGIDLVCNLDPDLPDITADRSQVLQVLTNLVVNSVQAMPDGGRLAIRTSRENDQVLLVVEDSGCGMDEKTLRGIFHPFFTTKDVDQGTGLGLSVVHGIVVSHDGRIDVTSRPGEGTRFSIRLPIAAPHLAESSTRGH